MLRSGRLGHTECTFEDSGSLPQTDLLAKATSNDRSITIVYISTKNCVSPLVMGRFIVLFTKIDFDAFGEQREAFQSRTLQSFGLWPARAHRGVSSHYRGSQIAGHTFRHA